MEVGVEDDDLQIVFEANEEEQQGTSTSSSSVQHIFKSSLGKRSKIWLFFKEASDPKKAMCNLCEKEISRSGYGKQASNTAMRNHLKAKHPNEFKESASGTECQKPASTATKQKLHSMFENRRLWDCNDDKAKEWHYTIGEMIAVDCKPISEVDKIGFQRLMAKAVPRYKIPSRKYLTDKIIPDMYTRCRSKIQSNIETATSITFTTDLWTAGHTNESFIDLSAHWINMDFERQQFALHLKHFPGSHTGQAIAGELNTMFENWKIGKERIHLLLRDGGPNVVKGAQEAAIPNESCFLHTLQLVIEDSISSQRMVNDTIASCRNIVTHFNHSSTSCSRLKEIQTELGMKNMKLTQDVSTRWNSTYYMLESVQRQKNSLSVFAVEESKIRNLNQNQWDILHGVLSLLKPFEEITKIISSSESIISEVIPYVCTMKLYLEEENESHKGVGTMKGMLKESLIRRLGSVFENKYFSVATFLDPRFKTAFLGTYTETVKMYVLQEICDASANRLPAQTMTEGETEQLHAVNPVTETSRQIEDTHSMFWRCFTKFTSATTTGTDSTNTDARNTSIEKRALYQAEINLFCSDSLLDRNENAFSWWRRKKETYPQLFQVARKYLSSPASTISSERLFSEAGNVYEEKRNKLLPINGEYLTFLHHNLTRLEFKY